MICKSTQMGCVNNGLQTWIATGHGAPFAYAGRYAVIRAKMLCQPVVDTLENVLFGNGGIPPAIHRPYAV
ncbi:hypothetical protein D3C87_1609810 [compost metagenome]